MKKISALKLKLAAEIEVELYFAFSKHWHSTPWKKTSIVFSYNFDRISTSL